MSRNIKQQETNIPPLLFSLFHKLFQAQMTIFQFLSPWLCRLYALSSPHLPMFAVAPFPLDYLNELLKLNPKCGVCFFSIYSQSYWELA